MGLAIADSSARLRSNKAVNGLDDRGSNMLVVSADGTTQEAVTSGKATISRFLIAPNDKLYVLFSSKVNLKDTSKGGGRGCLLAEVVRATGIPTCIEDELESITWISSGGVGHPSNPIQFDGSGAIYYLGQNASGSVSLRKNAGGTKTDLINDNISIWNFIVLEDGTVILTGTTTSTQANWVRRISPQGGLRNLVTSGYAQFLTLFPDNNVYMGLWGGGHFGIKRYLPSSDALDVKYWISGNMVGDEQDWYFGADQFCQNDEDRQTNDSFCGYYGAYIKGTHRTTDGKVFTIAGYDANGLLMQYYPELAKPSTAVVKVAVAQGVLTNLILAGLNSSDRNVLTLFNTTDQSELELIGAENEIEIYRLNFVASDNRIMFDGLRFSDNKYVIGQYDLNSMTFGASQTGSTKLVDFQTF